MHWFLKFILGMKFYMFRTVPLSIIRNFFTVHTAMVYVIQFCRQLASSVAVCQPVWHIPLLCVQWKTPDDGQRNCPKHVEFHSKNKFEKSVHLVVFIIGIYHDARSHDVTMHGHMNTKKMFVVWRVLNLNLNLRACRAYVHVRCFRMP
jgi:hypothetical protein